MSQSESLIKKPFTVDSKVVSELAFLFTIYILVTGLLILHFRAWEPDIVRQVLGIFAYPAAFFGGVALVWPYITNVIWILPIACLILMGLPFLMALLGAWSLLPLGVFGVTATLFAYRACHPKLRAKTLQLVLAGSILAVIYFVIYNSYPFANIFSDIAAYNNTISYSPDALFHSAIMQMLHNFNTPSIGLDGLKKISYHIFTHRWGVANLKILGGQAILLLGICQQVAFVPIFLFTSTLTLILLTSIEISALLACGFSLLSLWSSSIFVGLSYVGSESFTFSLAIFMAMLPVGRFWLFQIYQSRRWSTIHPLAIATAVLAILVCGATKISSGAMLALFLILCVSIPKIWQKDSISWVDVGRFLVLAIPFLLGCLVLGFTFSLSSRPLSLNLNAEFIPSVIAFIGLITLFYFLKNTDDKHYQRSQISMLTVMFVASQLPAIYIPANTLIYFVTVALFVASFFTMSSLADYCQNHRQVSLMAVANSVNYSGWHISHKLLSWGLIFVIVSSFTYILHSGTIPIIDKNRVQHIVGKAHRALNIVNEAEKIKQGQFEKLKQRTELGAIQSYIHELNLSPNRPKPTVIYVSPDFVDFWRHEQSEYCWAKPFVIPAMTGFPLLNGVSNRIDGCPGGESNSYFGLVDYKSESWNRPLSESDLCAKATQLGFVQVLSITDKSKYTLLTCPAKTASK